MNIQPADTLPFLDNLRFSQQAYKGKIKSSNNFHFDSFAYFNQNSFCNFVVEIY